MPFPPYLIVRQVAKISSSQAFRPHDLCRRLLSSSSTRWDRAIIYSENGDPSKVLSVLSYPSLPPPPPNSINIKFLLSPINPADINVIEGVYPSKPTKTGALTVSGKGSDNAPVFVGGNEGLAQVVALGEGVTTLSVNDWVIMTKQQSGTWSTSKNVAVSDVARVPNADKLTEAQGATMTVNPPTAYNMLSDFVDLREGDWVVQNGANSAVGQAVMQIATARGLKTLNLVRNRSDPLEYARLKDYLYGLGATQVLSYDELAEKSVRAKIKKWTNGRKFLLGLNCIGGNETTAMARLLDANAQLVSYGAMSKQPLSLPTSLFIFKNLSSRGFWQSRWYQDKSLAERDQLMQEIVGLMIQGKLLTPEHETVTIWAEETDEAASERVRSLMRRMADGRVGRKVLFKFESST